MEENKVIDLRNDKFMWATSHFENGEIVYQLIFDNTVIILNEEQRHRLMNY